MSEGIHSFYSVEYGCGPLGEYHREHPEAREGMLAVLRLAGPEAALLHAWSVLWAEVADSKRRQYLSQCMPPSIWGELIDKPRRDARLHPFYASGQRCEITSCWPNGLVEKDRGYIRRSRGWQPCYILLKQRNSTCGDPIFLDRITGIRPVGKRRLGGRRVQP